MGQNNFFLGNCLEICPSPALVHTLGIFIHVVAFKVTSTVGKLGVATDIDSQPTFQSIFRVVWQAERIQLFVITLYFGFILTKIKGLY